MKLRSLNHSQQDIATEGRKTVRTMVDAYSKFYRN